MTNNRVDFLRLYARLKLHPGLILVIPSIGPKEQNQLFRAALEHTRNRDLTNTVLEVHRKPAAIEIKEYAWPLSRK